MWLWVKPHHIIPRVTVYLNIIMGLYGILYNLWSQATNTLLRTGNSCFTRACMLSEFCCAIASMWQCMRDSLNFCWDLSSVMALTARPHFVRHIHENKYNSPVSEVELQETSQHYSLNQHSDGGQLNISVSDLAPGVSDIQEGYSSSEPINFPTDSTMDSSKEQSAENWNDSDIDTRSAQRKWDHSGTDAGDSLSDSECPNPSWQNRVRTRYFGQYPLQGLNSLTRNHHVVLDGFAKRLVV